ncbi:MAG: GNAT family N-acetyltransferase [Anaerolineae bacterium]|nr:GNAT family N-acetyltransferase [Anaerolineae bacterium]
MNGYQLVERVPTLAEYQALCTAVGWQDVINFEAAQAALDHSLYGVIVQQGDQTIGMGRIVGDGAIFFYIQDIAVDPAHQKRGVGTRIMQALMAHVDAHAPDQSFVGLFAAEGTPAFYRQYGFEMYSELQGMFKVVRR